MPIFYSHVSASVDNFPAVQPVSLTGALTVDDPNNSSTTPLAANAQFTGSWTDTFGFALVKYSVQSDVISAVPGLAREWSTDTVNIMRWDPADSLDSTRVGPTGGVVETAVPHARYFRIIYTNGNSPQTYFRLKSVLSRYVATGDLSDIGTPPVIGDHAMLVKSVIVGKSTAGGTNYVDVKVNPAGNLALATTPNLAGTAAVTATGVSGTSVTILAANTARLGAMVTNASQTGTLFVKEGTVASQFSYTIAIGPRGYWEIPYNYTGIVTAICTGTQTALAIVTEDTA